MKKDICSIESPVRVATIVNWFGITDVEDLLDEPKDKAGVPNQLVTIHRRKHDGFNRQELVDSFNAIREFLRKNHILTMEPSQ